MDTPENSIRGLAAVVAVAVIVFGIIGINDYMRRARNDAPPSESLEPGEEFASQVDALLREEASFQDGANEASSLTIVTALIAATGETTLDKIRGSVRNIDIAEIDNGVGHWHGRMLPGAIVTIQISTMNRSLGKHTKACLKRAVLSDKEFGVLRNVLTLECHDSDEAFAEWRSEAEFSSSSAAYSAISSQAPLKRYRTSLP
jgi:hypothetical protein